MLKSVYTLISEWRLLQQRSRISRAPSTRLIVYYCAAPFSGSRREVLSTTGVLGPSRTFGNLPSSSFWRELAVLLRVRCQRKRTYREYSDTIGGPHCPSSPTGAREPRDQIARTLVFEPTVR